MAEQLINLIPEEEQQEQQKARIIKMSTVVSVVIFVIVAGLSAYFFYKTATMKSEIDVYNEDIEVLRGKISDLAEIEIIARNLDARYGALQTLLSERMYYSQLLKEFYKRIPSSVVVHTFNYNTVRDSISVSGTGLDYMAVSSFITALNNSSFEGSAPGLEGLFTDVLLNSVTSDAQSDEAAFFIEVSVNGVLLKR
jgi:Tfp pilus assembly protein PilN